MSEKLISVPSMHDDHRDWQRQHSMWQHDLSTWQKEIVTATKKVGEFLKSLEHQSKVLSEYKKTIDQLESTLKTHEHEIASSEHYGSEVPESLTAKHLEWVKQAEAFAREHECIKLHHRELIARLNRVHTPVT